jgi:putative transcriptional regulator
MKRMEFNELLKSIDQARKIRAGKLKPGRVVAFNPVMVKNVRMKLNASQSAFAYMIGVSVDTLQNWEQGRRRPEGPALVLLRVAQICPMAIIKALHA